MLMLYVHKMTRKIWLNINDMIKGRLIKKTLFLFIVLCVFSSCTLNKSIKDKRGLFCSTKSGCIFDVVKLDSNNIFELERLVECDVGMLHYYSKGEWTPVSRQKIFLNFEPNPKWEWEKYYPESMPPQPFNLYQTYKTYIKMISEKKMFFISEGEKIILRSDWCDCIPKDFLIVGGERYGIP